MILLWGVPRDPPMGAVRAALARLGREAFFLDQHQILQTDVELDVDGRVGGRLRPAGRELDLSEVEAVYLRPYDVRRLPALAGTEPGADAWTRAVNVDDALASWADLTSSLVVNRPSAMAANAAKPYQSAWIRRFGFDTPETLVTTDPDAVREFRDEHGTVVYKSISGTRSVVARLTDADDARVEDVAWCPTQFQAFVPGRDVRVHVVGNELFACRVGSDADDYRYAGRTGHGVTLESCALDADVTRRCLDMSVDMGLLVSGIDLRETPDGRWFCFEVNPSPGFTYFAAGAGQPIAYAIAHLLASGHAPAGWSERDGDRRPAWEQG